MSRTDAERELAREYARLRLGYPPEDVFNERTQTLNTYQLIMGQEISLVDTPVHIEQRVQMTARNMRMELRAFLAGSAVQVHERLVRVPATWHDAFRLAYCKTWWLRLAWWVCALCRRPWPRVRYTEHKLTTEDQMYFPDISTEFKETQRHFIMRRDPKVTITDYYGPGESE